VHDLVGSKSRRKAGEQVYVLWSDDKLDNFTIQVSNQLRQQFNGPARDQASQQRATELGTPK